jgi:hypothetical protein
VPTAPVFDFSLPAMFILSRSVLFRRPGDSGTNGHIGLHQMAVRVQALTLSMHACGREFQ